jgi:exosortase/archaeosortase family protein
VIANAARVAGTGLAASWIGPQAAEGFFHTFSGWLVFVAAFCVLTACARLLARVQIRRPALAVSAS